MKLPPQRDFALDTNSGLMDRQARYETDLEVATQVVRMSRIIHQETGTWIWQSIHDAAYSRFLSAVHDEDTEEIAQQLSNFFRETISRGLVSHIVFDAAISNPDNWQRAHSFIFKDMETWMLLTDHLYDMEPLQPPLVGNPFGIIIEPGILVTPDACRHHYHATVIRKWLDKIRWGDTRLTVLEIGGGYGGFAYYLYKLGGGYPLTYINIDLEVPLYISLYYLMTTVPGLLNRHIQTLVVSNQTISKNDIDTTDIILAHNSAADKIDSPIDIVYNSNSLSEMPESDIVRYFDLIDRCNPKIIFQQNSNLPIHSDEMAVYGQDEFPASMFPYPKRYVEAYRAKSPWMSEAGFYYEFLHIREDCLAL